MRLPSGAVECLQRVWRWAIDKLLTGTLYAYVAFDWGEEVDLERARQLVPADVQALPRRPRTPSSFAYRPAPLRCPVPPVAVTLPHLGTAACQAEATIFDFAAVSVDVQIPFQLEGDQLLQLAGCLATPDELVEAARQALLDLYRRLEPAIRDPKFHELSEEYFVFHLPPQEAVRAASIIDEHSEWLAGILRLEESPLDASEIAEALKLALRYSPDDLFLPDWGAALLLDRDCEETLQIIEFTNLQLLEFRYIDARLDGDMNRAYRMMHRLKRRALPFWRPHTRPLREIGELKAEATDLFERTGNVLKLVGDQYLARVYRQLAARFHLADWEHSIQRKLEVLEGIYELVFHQASIYRTELLEAIIVALIVVEIFLSLFRH